jgi:hypothetical protein
MIRPALMLLSLTVSTFFLFAPDVGPDRYKPYKCPHCSHEIKVDTWTFPDDSERIDFFPLADKTLFPDTYIFLGGVHVIHVLMALGMVMAERELSIYQKAYVLSATVFLWIHAVDTVFYFLSYGEPFNSIKMTWNIAKIIIFAYAVSKEKH